MRYLEEEAYPGDANCIHCCLIEIPVSNNGEDYVCKCAYDESEDKAVFYEKQPDTLKILYPFVMVFSRHVSHNEFRDTERKEADENRDADCYQGIYTIIHFIKESGKENEENEHDNKIDSSQEVKGYDLLCRFLIVFHLLSAKRKVY